MQDVDQKPGKKSNLFSASDSRVRKRGRGRKRARAFLISLSHRFTIKKRR